MSEVIADPNAVPPDGWDAADDDQRSITIEELSERAIVRLPRLDGPAWEADLARGMASARDRSRGRLADDVPDLDRVLTAPWASASFLLDVAATVVDRFGLPALFDSLITEHELRPQRLQALDGAQPIGAEAGFGSLVPGFDLPKATATGVAANVSGGGGVTIFGVDDHDRALARWLEDWDRTVQATCRADLSLVGSRRGALAPADESVRLVLAVDRPVEVRIWPLIDDPADRRSPLTVTDVAATASTDGWPTGQGEPAAVLTIDRGHGVCIPPGCGIDIGWASVPALVLTVVVPQLTLGKLAMLVQADATYWPMLRGDVPWDRGAAVRSWGGSTHDPNRGLAASMREVIDAVPLDRVRARVLGGLVPRSMVPFTATAAARYGTGRIRLRCPVTGFAVYDDETLPVPDGFVALACSGRRVVMPEAAATVLAAFADGQPRDVVEATHGLGGIDPDVSDPVDALLDAGLLEVSP